MTTPNPFERLFRGAAGEAPADEREQRLPPAVGGGTGRPPVDPDPEAVRGSELPPAGQPAGDTLLRRTARENQPAFPTFDPYRRGEEWEPERWPIEEVVALQRHLQALGLLDGPYRLGRWDRRSAGAYEELLAFANQMGGKSAPFPEVVARYGELELVDPELDQRVAGIGSFAAPAFRPPNPEAVAQALDAMWEQEVGRPMDAAEKARFTAAFNRLQRQAHETEVGVARGEFDAEQEAELQRLSQETGIPVEALRPAQDPNAPGALPADTPQTDPQAEFAALVEQHLAAEVEGQEQAEDAQGSNRLVSGVFGDLARLMQGGGVG